MTTQKHAGFNAELEIKEFKDAIEQTEEEIIDLFLKLPYKRQKAILASLWSEHKPAKPKGQRNYDSIPY